MKRKSQQAWSPKNQPESYGITVLDFTLNPRSKNEPREIDHVWAGDSLEQAASEFSNMLHKYRGRYVVQLLDQGALSGGDDIIVQYSPEDDYEIPYGPKGEQVLSLMAHVSRKTNAMKRRSITEEYEGIQDQRIRLRDLRWDEKSIVEEAQDAGFSPELVQAYLDLKEDEVGAYDMNEGGLYEKELAQFQTGHPEIAQFVDNRAKDLFDQETSLLNTLRSKEDDYLRENPEKDIFSQFDWKEASMKRKAQELDNLDDVLAQLIDMEVESLLQESGESWETVTYDDIPEYVFQEAKKFENAVEEALNEWVDSHPEAMVDDASGWDLYNEDGPYNVLMTLNGHGVGIWDGCWDHLIPEKEDIKDLERFLDEKLGHFAEDTGTGSLNEALMEAAYELYGDDYETEYEGSPNIPGASRYLKEAQEWIDNALSNKYDQQTTEESEEGGGAKKFKPGDLVVDTTQDFGGPGTVEGYGVGLTPDGGLVVQVSFPTADQGRAIGLLESNLRKASRQRRQAGNRGAIAEELLRDCPEESLDDHEAIAEAVRDGESWEVIEQMPELDRWPSTYSWLKMELKASRQRRRAREMNFNTKQDVETYALNSGVFEWEWGGAASLEGFVSYLWKNFDASPENEEAALFEYLESVGEDPSNYGLGRNSSVGQRKQAYFEDDQSVATELLLYADNTAELYPQKQAIEKNLVNKMARGVYDPELAVKAFMYWMESAAKGYAREFGGEDYPGSWHEMFPKNVREMAAREAAERFADHAESGEYDHMLHKKYQKG